MFRFKGYRITETLSQDKTYILYRGIRSKDNLPVILKTHESKHPTPRDIAMLSHEYEIMKTNCLAGAAKPLALHKDERSAVLILEDIGGDLLERHIGQSGLELDMFLWIAIELSRIVSELHQADIIHKDLNPKRFVANMNTKEIRIVDCAQVSLMPHETTASPVFHHVSLAYMSPEQTGRMNRQLDYRTDLYSLGVIFYELLTGKLPFSHNDPSTLLHCHLAKRPVPPDQTDKKIPGVISDIVMKLLEKSAEDRYLSARGLKADLETAFSRLQSSGKIEVFPLRGKDISDTLKVSQKLYGRSSEAHSLLDVFHRACEGPVEMMMVSGYAGVGKTSLIHQIYQSVAREKGYFISGGFTEFQQNKPYGALLEAFKLLIREILAENETTLQYWKKKLVAALGSNGGLIIEVIPEVALLIGPQPPVMKMDPVASTNRFGWVLFNFIRCFCEKEHPVTLFLDDLQWVDSATLKLFEQIMADQEIQYLFLVGAFRDNEVGSTHPLMNILKRLRRKNARYHHLTLEPLGTKHVTRLVSDTLVCDMETAAPLSKLIFAKTGGNPFCINQFFGTLYDNGLLSFDANRGRWLWDLSTIRGMGITSDMAVLLTQRLEGLSVETLELLQIASCMGDRFDLRELSVIAESSASSVIDKLLPAVKASLVIPVAKDGTDEQINEKDEEFNSIFKFQHSRVHETVYNTIGKKEKKARHLQIGRFLRQNTSKRPWEEDTFEIVNHFNMAADSIGHWKDRMELAELNLRAAQKARVAAAIETAYNYYKTGVSVLPDDSWEIDYELTLSLYTGGVETAGLGGQYAHMETWFDRVKKNTRDLLDQTPSYRSVIQTYVSQNKLIEAIDLAEKILSTLGFSLPVDPTATDSQRAFKKSVKTMAGKDLLNYKAFPEMKDPYTRAAMDIITTIYSATFIGRPQLFPYLVCKQMEISVRHGLSPNATFAYCAYGALVCSEGEDIDFGYQLGQQALKMTPYLNAREYEGKVYHSWTLGVMHSKGHIRETVKTSAAGYHSAVAAGDFEFAGYNLYLNSMHLLLSGETLGAASEQMLKNEKLIRNIKQKAALIFNGIFRQAALNFKGESEAPCLLVGGAYDERIMIPQYYATSEWLASFYTYLTKLILCYFFEDYGQAYKIANLAEAEKKSRWGYGLYSFSVFSFFDSLARLSYYPRAPKQEQKQILDKVEANQDRIKAWASHAPMNYLNKYQLVEAERFRILGEDMQAMMFYDKAIASAREHEFIHEEALANELAAEFWIAKEKHDFAFLYIQNAYRCYSSWGARAKAIQIEKKYPEFSSRFTGSITQHTDHYPGRGTGAEGPPVGMDLSTMIKASHAISSEIEIDVLLKTLIRVVIENAGAQNGFLILESDGKLLIEASGTVEKGGTVVRPPIPFEKEQIAGSIIGYVARTRRPVVLDNASEDARFAKDPHIRSGPSKSVLCTPIIHKSEMIGLFYLENRLVAGAFTPARLEMLKVMASQIAISIENARLFSDLAEAEHKYRGIFENAVEGIFQTSPVGEIISINAAFARMLGYDSREDLLASLKCIEEGLYTDATRHKALFKRLNEEAVVSGFEIELYRKDRSRIWACIHARQAFDKKQNRTIVEGIITDITEQHRIREALQKRERQLRKENILLRSNLKDRYKFGNIIGKSPSMQEAYEYILKAAATANNVIIYGESGTGKELVARAIHDNSDRKNKRFIPVNCGAIPTNLLESEFFGYKKGAFTGAAQDKPGFLAQADGGTLFLDELGEIDLNLQVKLLRVLEGGGYIPVGGSELMKPNVRFVAATNRDLRERVEKGSIREDFFYRVHIIPIYLPPLRERKEDIPLLLEHFIKVFGEGEKTPPFPLEAQEVLRNYHWPGNVRELQNTIQRYITLNTLDFMETFRRKDPDRHERIGGLDYKTALEIFEKRILKNALEQNHWHREKAAASLGLPRRTFFRKLSKFDLVQKG